MSKDVVIAGVIVAACLGLVTVAFVVPKQKTVATDIAKKEKDEPLPPTSPSVNDLLPTTPGDPLLANNNPPGNTFTPIGSNPSDPFAKPNDPFAKPGNPYPPSNNPFNNPPSNNAFPPITPPPALPVEPPPSKSEVSEAKTHVVATGETLGEISAKYYGSAKHWKKIAEANKVDANDLKVGQKLTIPAMEKAAAPTTSPTPELANGERSYTIQKGDSFYSIAKKELGSASRWKEIEKLNNMSADDLQVGKAIKLPAKAAAVEKLNPTPDAPATGDANVHVVAAGETLSDISKKHYGTTSKWKDIVKANPGVDPEGLKVGQKLKLPEIAGTTPAPSTGTSPEKGTGAPADNPAATYTVKAGEYLEDIAQSQLGSRGAWKKIVDANPGIDPKKLRVGQKLVIPGKSAPPEPKVETPAPPSFGAPGFGTPPSGTGKPGSTQPSGFGSQPSGFGAQPSGFGSQPSGTGKPGSTQPSGFGAQPSGFGSQPTGFGSQPGSGSSYPPPPTSTPAPGTGTSFGSPSATPPVNNDNPFAVPPSTGTRPTP